MAEAILTIDQTGLPAGTPNVSREDGLGTGATVTLTSSGVGTTHEFTLLWVPEDDSTAVASFSAGATTATFTPDATSVGGTYRIRLRVTDALGESTVIHTFSILTANLGLRIPAMNERADDDASLENSGATYIAASETNAPIAGGPFASGSYGGWHPALSKALRELDVLGGIFTGADHVNPTLTYNSYAAPANLAVNTINTISGGAPLTLTLPALASTADSDEIIVFHTPGTGDITVSGAINTVTGSEVSIVLTSGDHVVFTPLNSAGFWQVTSTTVGVGGGAGATVPNPTRTLDVITVDSTTVTEGTFAVVSIGATTTSGTFFLPTVAASTGPTSEVVVLANLAAHTLTATGGDNILFAGTSSTSVLIPEGVSFTLSAVTGYGWVVTGTSKDGGAAKGLPIDTSGIPVSDELSANLFYLLPLEDVDISGHTLTLENAALLEDGVQVACAVTSFAAPGTAGLTSLIIDLGGLLYPIRTNIKYTFQVDGGNWIPVASAPVFIPDTYTSPIFIASNIIYAQPNLDEVPTLYIGAGDLTATATILADDTWMLQGDTIRFFIDNDAGEHAIDLSGFTPMNGEVPNFIPKWIRHSYVEITRGSNDLDDDIFYLKVEYADPTKYVVEVTDGNTHTTPLPAVDGAIRVKVVSVLADDAGGVALDEFVIFLSAGGGSFTEEYNIIDNQFSSSDSSVTVGIVADEISLAVSSGAGASSARFIVTMEVVEYPVAP